MAVFFSAGVFIRELDFSQFAPTSLPTVFAVVGGATTGPINVPTLVTSTVDLVQQFGNPTTATFGLYAAMQWLRNGNQLRFVRVVDGTESYATTTFTGAASSAVFIGNKNLAAGTNMSDKKNVKIKIDAGSATQVDASAGAADVTRVGINTIIDNINNAFSTNVASENKASGDASTKTFTFTLTNPNVQKRSVSIKVTAVTQGTDNGGGIITGAGITSGTINYTTGVVTVTFVTAPPAVANNVTAAYRYGPIADSDNTGAFLVIHSNTTGTSSQVQFSAPSTADASFILLGVSTYPNTTNGFAASATALTVNSSAQGSAYNGFKAQIETGTNTNTFKLTILNTTNVKLEIFDNLTKANAEATINGVSQFVIVDDNTNSTPPSNALQFLLGGSDGISALDDADFIGTATGGPDGGPSGLQTLRDVEKIDVSILAVPGISTGAVVDEMIDICQTRGDAITLIDPPSGLTAQKAADYANGAGAYAGDHAAFNSSYAAIYWPWVKIFDAVNDTELFVPPSGVVASQYAFTDRTADQWFAPAGLNRGILTTVLALESQSPDLGTRDFLQQNSVNPIVNFPGQGIVIWGQRTTLRTNSALNRVNVRRMLSFIEKIIAVALRPLVFEPNDDFTRRRAVNIVTPLLSSVAARRGIERFEVRIDESTNPPSVVNNNQLAGKIFIIPTKSAEVITLDFILLPTGASFDEGNG